MNDEQIYDEEDVLEDETSVNDDLSSDESSSLEDKLDCIEALLNEDIALREGSEPELVTSSGTETVSDNQIEPDYSQYIYDLLTDSTVKVELVQQEEDIMNKSLSDYSVSESLLVVILLVVLGALVYNFIEAHVFKRR